MHHEAIAQLRAKIVEAEGPEKIILFGSYASATTTESSDISYAPWGTKPCLNEHEWAKRQLEKRRSPTKPWIAGSCRARMRPNYSTKSS